MGMRPSQRHGYPPSDKRGHRMPPTNEASRSTRLFPQTAGSETNPPSSYYAVPMANARLSESSDSEVDFELRREIYGVSSISEKFSLLSRPPTGESTRLLQTKRCFSMHVVRAYMARGMQKKQRQRRDPSFRLPINRLSPSSSSSSSPEVQLVPRPQWTQDSQPDLSDEEADAAWVLGNQRLLGEGIHLASPPNVSSFTGGNTLKVTADVQHPEQGKIQAKIALDTQSDVSTCLREFLTNIRPIVPDEITGVGGLALFSEEGILHLSGFRGQAVSVPALVAPSHQLPCGCIALLGVPALQVLEVAIDKHLRLPQFSPLICHLGEKKLREWLDHHPESKVDTSPFDITAIQICPDLSPN